MDVPKNVHGDCPDFGSTEFLLNHIQSILQFYDDRCIDKKGGGFYQHFKVILKQDCDISNTKVIIYIYIYTQISVYDIQ